MANKASSTPTSSSLLHSLSLSSLTTAPVTSVLRDRRDTSSDHDAPGVPTGYFRFFRRSLGVWRFAQWMEWQLLWRRLWPLNKHLLSSEVLCPFCGLSFLCLNLFSLAWPGLTRVHGPRLLVSVFEIKKERKKERIFCFQQQSHQ